MTITLRSGKFMEDIGSGSSENQVFQIAKSNAQKGAITDAIKRFVILIIQLSRLRRQLEEFKSLTFDRCFSLFFSTLLRFGRRLGTCLKDPEFVTRALQYQQDHSIKKSGE